MNGWLMQKKSFVFPLSLPRHLQGKHFIFGTMRRLGEERGGDIFSTKRSKAHTYHDLDNLTKGNFSNGNREMNI